MSKKIGRPRIKFTDEIWDGIKKLCALHCTAVEIASWFNFSVDTLERRIREKEDMTFAEFQKTHSAKGKISLRRAQYKNAIEHNNVTMQIFLGKQWLNQKDNEKSDEEKNKKFDDITDKLDELIKK